MFFEEYERICLLGEGAFAKVFKVRHAQLGYIRALKVSDHYIEDENDSAWQTFLAECKVLLRIGNGSHPNIVKIFQPRLINNHAVVEMDCVEGDTLHKFIQQNKFIPIEEFFLFAKQIISALTYCHVDVYKFMMNPTEDHLETKDIDPNNGRKFILSPEKEAELIKKYGVVHNDLHSGNIIKRDYDGQYILLDFGLAIQNSHCVKSSSRFDGAIEYCSPEKLENGTISTQSDVYALGILLYEMLAGRVPFPYSNGDGSTPESARSRVYQQHLQETPPPVFEFRKQAFEATHPGETYTQDYPEQLEAIIMKCLAKKPEERFKNAKELQDMIGKLVEDIETTNSETGQLKEKLANLQSQLQSIKEDNKKLSSEHEGSIEFKPYIDNKSDKKWKYSTIIISSILFPLSCFLGYLAYYYDGKSAWAWRTYNTALRVVEMVDPNVYADGDDLIRHDTITDQYHIIEDYSTVFGKEIERLKIENDSLKRRIPSTQSTHSSVQTKVEYRTSPEIQNELNRLKAENNKNTAEVNRLKSQIQEKDRHIKALKDELFK